MARSPALNTVFNLPANRPFLPDLAQGLIERFGTTLADTLVLMPSRRACLALRDAFLTHCGDGAMLLPRMQPVADTGSGDLPVDSETLDLPPAIDPLRRQLLLARLVRAKQPDMTDEHAIRLAADLADLLDELQTEEIDLARLDGLIGDELADHWREILQFLHILGRNWPAVLAHEEAIDPSERRRLLLDRVIGRWHTNPPAHPVVAAGITGTIPAVARLLRAVRELPNGTVILPGLDLHLDDASWQAVATAPTHPQYGLHRLLGELAVERSDIETWPAPVASSPRAQLLSDIMRPARTSDIWQTMPAPPDAATLGLELAEMRDFAAEAELLALRMREALSEPLCQVALVTSDRTLGRRVAAELRRFDIDVDDSAGVPLDQTPPGSFLILSARAIIDMLPPVQFLALLKHPLAKGGMADGAFRRYTRSLERAVMRGTRRAGGFAALKAAILDGANSSYWPSPIKGVELARWIDGISDGCCDLQTLTRQPDPTIPQLIEAHLAFAEWLAANEDGDAANLWAKEAGQAAAGFMSRLLAAADDFGPIAVSAYPALLAVLMGSVPVHPQTDRHPRTAILGQLESRLHQADVVLIGGLNEGIWPRPPEPSPWLNRAMRKALGLPPAEQQIGIAAHDFSQMASAPRVLMTRAGKDAAGSPTTPSRWLARLDAVLRAKAKTAQIEMDGRWYQWATKRVALTDVVPTQRPEPRPPITARPRGLWVTDIETLMRNPYQFYARRILGLSELEPLDSEPGAAERGQIIHAALEEFVQKYPVDLPENALEIMLRMGRDHFELYAANPQVHAIWWPRFLPVAEWFLSQETARRARLERVLAERTGEATFNAQSGEFKLMARADRIELGSDSFTIVDYKTGQIPKPMEVVAGLKPQLPLTALIAEADGFRDVAGMNAAELLYWGLKGGNDAGTDSNPLIRHDVALVIEEAKFGIARLVDYFNDLESAYPAVPRPEISGLHSAFDHLARNKEWQGSLAVRGDDT